MKCNYWSAYDQIKLPDAASDRIRRALELRCSHTEKEARFMRKTGRRLSTLAIAVIVAAVLCVGAAAAAVALSRVNMNVTEINEANIEDGTEQSACDITFEAADSDYIDLGTWYPQSIPDGFEETFISDGQCGIQNIDFENADGDLLGLCYQKAGSNADIELENVVERQDVTVNGETGILYISGSGEKTNELLVWTDSERGIGFDVSYYGSADVDLVAFADSVTEQDEPLTPTNAGEKDKALAELGDYAPADLPDGYSLENTYGYPTEDGGGWYGYVNKVFSNAGHEEIHLYYETLDGADFENTCVAGYRDSEGEYTCTDLTVNGQSACLIETADGAPHCLLWTNADESLSFSLSADGLTGDQLIQVAQSVALQ